MKTKRITYVLWVAAWLGVSIAPNVDAQPWACDFSGTAMYHGRLVNTSDQIKAYDPGGQDCTGFSGTDNNGNFLVTVNGDQSETGGIDEGAPENSAITFRINGEVAQLFSGSNIVVKNGNITGLDIRVLEQPPDANPGGPYSGTEGSAVSFNGSGSTGAVTYAWTFGDGGTGSGPTPSHTYVDNGTYTVGLTVTNNSGQSDTENTTATIGNALPVVTVTSDQPKNEGSVMSFMGSHTDAGANDAPFTYSWTFGDGGTAGNVTNPTHTYVNDGIYTVTLSVKDKDNGTGTKQIQVTMNNVPPTVEAGSNKSTNEGSPVGFNGSATDPGTADVLTFNWNFGDGGTAIGQNVSHTFADEGSGTYTVTLTVNDGKDNGTDQLTVTVSNVAPTAEAGGPYTGTVGYSIQFNGTASDPGSDVLTYTWDLDEDGLYDDFPGPNPQKTYNSVGTYSIGLRVTDGDGGVATDNATVSVSEGVQITIRTSDSGMQVNVDGTMYPSPKVFSFAPGSMHEVNVPYEQLVIEGRQRWVFQSWSDGGQKNHIITVPYSQREYVANYQQFYYLDIDENGMSGGNIQGENWYTPGSVATIHVDAAVTDQAGTTRYQFVRWEGIGSGSYTGSELTAYVHVNEPIVERVIWGAKQYLLSLNSPFGNPTGAAWYAQGATASFSVDTAMNSQSGTRSKFKRWVGQGSGSYTGSVNTATITMNNPVVEQAEWNTEYYLDLVSAYGAPTGEKWYTAGAQATVSIDTVAGAATDTRKRFLQWTGQGGGSYTGGNPIFTIIMNNPITETVQWQQQYHVQVVSFVGIPKGGGWYADGGTASISTDTVVAAGTGVRYKFNQWQGTGTGSYTGTDPVKNIIVHAPMRQEVLWKVQYWITMGIDPVGSGTVTPIPSPGGWGTRLDTLSLMAIGSSQENYSFFEWGGDTTSSTNPLKLVVKKTQNLIARFRKGNITLTTDPVGLLLIVDGVQVVSPYGRNWLQGEKHTIGSLTNQGDNVNTKFVFTSWSDDGALEHSIDVPASVATYTAKFNASYSVNVQSQYGTPTESSWYAAGTTATVKVDTAVEQPGGLRQKFNGWTGTGSGSYTGPANPASFQVNGPIMQKAEWKLQYKLNATTYPYPAPGARLSITPTGPWYDSGNNVQLEVNVLDPSYSFTGWSGDANGTTNPISFIMNAGKNVTANFKTPNSPPQITALPDTSMWEDMELRFSFAWLSRFIRDDNDPLSSLTYELIGTSHFTWSLDPAAQVAILKPVQNWSGTERIIVKVADPMGMFDTDTLSVRVFPMADPPTEFSLLSPKDNVVMLVWNTSPLFFTWQKSTDPDPGDYIRYNFFFGSEPTITQGSTLVTNLQDTSIYMTIPASGVYYWGVTAFDTQGNRKSSTVFRIDIRTDVEEDGLKGQPGSFALLQNYPNPFNPETTIRYALPQPADVRLLVFDLQGRLIRALVEKRMPAGYHEALWDARDAFGRLVPSGVYLLKMKAGDFFQQKRMVLLK